MGQLVVDALEADPAVRDVLDSFVLGRTPPTHPVLIMHNINDDAIPGDRTQIMVDAWRRGGGDVSEANIDTPPLTRSWDSSGTEWAVSSAPPLALCGFTTTSHSDLTANTARGDGDHMPAITSRDRVEGSELPSASLKSSDSRTFLPTGGLRPCQRNWGHGLRSVIDCNRTDRSRHHGSS